MSRVKIFPLQHRGELQKGISFPSNAELNQFLKNMDGMKWSRTHRCYYLLNTVTNKNRIFDNLVKIGHYLNYSAFTKAEKKKGIREKPEVSIEKKQVLNEYTTNPGETKV